MSSLARKLFGKHLLLTNTVVSGGLMGLGDFAQQNIERLSNSATTNTARTPHKYDWKRTARMTTVGLLAGPLVHGWYKFLDGKLQGISRTIVTKKVVADQLVASPALLLGFFFGMGTMEGKSLDSCAQEIKQKFVFLYLIDCLFWPPLQVINFRFLPQHFRVIYVSSAVLVWDIFLSYVKHKNYESEATKMAPSTSSL